MASAIIAKGRRPAENGQAKRDYLRHHLGIMVYFCFFEFADFPGAFSYVGHIVTMPPMVILICMLLAYAVLGMFMDTVADFDCGLPCDHGFEMFCGRWRAGLIVQDDSKM
ncbi:MAG: hypothetical protein ACPG5U_02535 [Planktomarina sp.]